jgi:hypothetical protein
MVSGCATRQAQFQLHQRYSAGRKPGDAAHQRWQGARLARNEYLAAEKPHPEGSAERSTEALGPERATLGEIGHRLGRTLSLAVTTAKRTPAAPDIPTVAESGMPGFDVPGWYALFVPAKTPPDIVRKMHADTVATLPNLKSGPGWKNSG